jgi:cell division protein FtsI (penicillin-binding protein 3)
VREIFLHSSNVGAGMLALEAGRAASAAFLARWASRAHAHGSGPVATPLLPKHWGRIETITVATVMAWRGAAAVRAAPGAARERRVEGDAHAAGGSDDGRSGRAWCRRHQRQVREIMRLNVTNAQGTGRHAEADGYRVGGKTGTAEMPGRGGYRRSP